MKTKLKAEHNHMNKADLSAQGEVSFKAKIIKKKFIRRVI